MLSLPQESVCGHCCPLLLPLHSALLPGWVQHGRAPVPPQPHYPLPQQLPADTPEEKLTYRAGSEDWNYRADPTETAWLAPPAPSRCLSLHCVLGWKEENGPLPGFRRTKAEPAPELASAAAPPHGPVTVCISICYQM
uniref:Uncharacterized protein n=1 Tax=Myotis myotis TaxID=51298 RepID=A0A7J7Z5M2_MYOMY|nr:hypothetical protein mMyoMyo1_010614 [Myotis myotis]